MHEIDSTSAPLKPGVISLFNAFFGISIMGFGGVMPWARWMVVEQRRWFTPAEFNEVLSLCQFLPGPNIVNLTAVFGSRMRGWSGAVAAWAGFLIFPFFLMVAAAVLYGMYSDVEALRRVLSGLAAAAAGLLIATVIKMAAPLFEKLGPTPLVAIATAGAIGVMRWPLVAVLLVLVPTSIALAWWWARR